MGINEAFEAAVSEQDSSPVEETQADSTSETDSASTDVAEPAAEGQTGDTQQQGEVDGQDGTDSDGDGTDQSNQGKSENSIPQGRFNEVNEQKKQYAEALQTIMSDPAAYKRAYREIYGKDPSFDPGTSVEDKSATQQDEDISAFNLPELDEEAFTTDVERMLYQGMQHFQKLAQNFKSTLDQVLPVVQQTSSQTKDARNKAALAEFNSAVDGVEKAYGVKLDQKARLELANEAKLYNVPTISEAVGRAAKVKLFDTMRQKGREEGASVKAAKKAAGNNQTNNVSGPTQKDSSAKMSTGDAIRQTFRENGIALPD